jgi:hypothetical protein
VDFFILRSRCAPTEKKNTEPTASETMKQMVVVVNGKTVPRILMTQWISKIEGIQTL